MSGTLQQQQQLQQQQPMVNFKRPQHNLKLANVLESMLQSGSLVDVTIYCDDGQVNAHKLVLAASSTYFRNLFSKLTNAFHYPIIVLREMPVNDLKTIIQFLYHGEVNVPQNRVDSLMRCAHYLQIECMASSANSLNAILASTSSMSHHALLSVHAATSVGGPMSTNVNNTINNSNNSSHLNNKLQAQYPPNTNSCKPSRGHGSRSSGSGGGGGANQNSTNSNTSDSKPKHTCQVCFKTFTHGFTLKRHMKLHSQSRLTIYCDVCSKSYSCKDSFLRHKKSSGHLQHTEYSNHRSIDMNLGSDR